MDLYGASASIGQANALTQQAREINQATNDFNNSLAEQLDTALTEEDMEQAGINQKNILSAATAGSKFVTSAEARGDILKAGKKVLTTPGKIIPVSLREKMGREAAEQFVARRAFVEAEERTGAAGVFAGEEAYTAAEAEAERFGGDIRDIGAEALAGGERVTAVAQEGEEVGRTAIRGAGGIRAAVSGARTAATEAVSNIAGTAGQAAAGEIGTGAGAKIAKEAAEKGAGAVLKTGAKAALAGVGGVLDVAQDIERATKGGKGWDVFGSNNWSRVGNIGNIVGSGLEVAGVFGMAFPPLGIGLEALGAGISLASAGAETYGDIKAGQEKEDKTTTDIESQRRSQSVAGSVETATSRIVS